MSEEEAQALINIAEKGMALGNVYSLYFVKTVIFILPFNSG